MINKNISIYFLGGYVLYSSELDWSPKKKKNVYYKKVGFINCLCESSFTNCNILTLDQAVNQEMLLCK